VHAMCTRANDVHVTLTRIQQTERYARQFMGSGTHAVGSMMRKISFMRNDTCVFLTGKYLFATLARRSGRWCNHWIVHVQVP
jgi:hypothetical protein